MRKSILIFCGIVLAVCLWLVLHRRTEVPGVAGAQAVAVVATNQKQATSPKALVTPQVQNAPASTAIAPNNSMTNASNAINPKIEELLQKPIDFYGMVVDENSNLVAGASVEFRWDDLTADSWTDTSVTTSDAEGLFSLHGKRGATLTVSATRDGYYSSPKDTGSFHYAFPNDNQVYSPDQRNPAIFHLRKKGESAKLVTSENGIRPDLAALVPIDGSPVSVDLLQKKVGSRGDLAVSQVKPDRGQWQQATNWSFHLNIPAGGFIEENDAFPFTAPETGYQSTVNLDFVKGETNWATQFAKTYYIAFGQPQKYGWLRVESDIAQQTVFLTYAINPNGSRNLEPK